MVHNVPVVHVGLDLDGAIDGDAVAATIAAGLARLDLEADALQVAIDVAEEAGLARPELDHRRHQKRLACHATGGIGLPQAFEGDALVRRVLVDQHHRLAALADEIAVEDLPDDAQR